MDLAKSTLIGAAAGAATTFAAVYLIGVTAAIAMPVGWPDALWLALVVFGLGAFLPAALINLAGLLTFKPDAFVSLVSFCVVSVAVTALTVGLTYSGHALAAMILGAVSSTAAARMLWSNNSFKPKPLRGSA